MSQFLDPFPLDVGIFELKFNHLLDTHFIYSVWDPEWLEWVRCSGVYPEWVRPSVWDRLSGYGVCILSEYILIIKLLVY